MANKDTTSDDTKTIVTVLLLLFVYPVGVVVMWFWTKWKTWVKLLVSLPLLFIPLLIFGAALLAAINPQGATEKAECVSDCSVMYEEGSVELQECVTDCTFGE
jgi:ABC-type sulfate transport system permease component